ncbi:unnamed protein product [Ambrosiozyma monospora]|uniref:Unnamed protein product n=1 Tax=Ambrosiozyma monospora TaxID=43982 RepID=A0ACB5T831_AMBMO|nr:unnamed protein product [Ambrosiozyma monospora]
MKSHKNFFEKEEDLEAQDPQTPTSSKKLTEGGSPKAHFASTDSDSEPQQINKPASLKSFQTDSSPLSLANPIETIMHPEENEHFSLKVPTKTSLIAANLETEEHISPITAIILLTITTVIVAFAAEYMVDAIGDIAEESGISTAFIAMILIPIAGNVVEHVTSVAVSLKGKMDLAIGVALGSALQIALFVYPLLVFISWGLDNGLTFVFNGFDIAVLCATAVLVYALIGDGKTHFLEGVVLIFTYVIVAVCYYFTPSTGYEV